jgi:sigma-B regulation protein RsbU (phosphoserine phosphatase)
LSDPGTPGVERPPEEDFEDLYENAPCGYLSLRPDGSIFKSNATLSHWLGMPPEDLLGQRFNDLLGKGARIFYETHFAPLIVLQGFFNEVALDLMTADGNRAPMLVNATQKKDVTGRHISTRMTLFNASERRRYEKDLLAARDAAEDAKRQLHDLNVRVQASLLDEKTSSALREQFIAVLGHDLRNPLAAISGGLRLMQKTPLDPRAAAVAVLIENSILRMGGLIDNVMDFARGRLGGGLTLDRSDPDSVEPILRQIADELLAAAPDRTIALNLDCSEPVACDRRRIGQLVSNLIGNALTHGALGEPVTLGASTADGWLEVYVANSGDPIPDLVMKTIFDPFRRGTLRPSMQGLGLGLYIAHEIATAHGGTLAVVSTAEETRFTFRMPVTAPTA